MIQTVRSVTGMVTKIPPSTDSQISKLAQSRVGMPVFRGTSYQDHLDAWNDVIANVEGDLWKLGAIAASLDRKRGDADVATFAKAVGLSTRRIYEIVQTYNAFEECGRSQASSFSLHEEAKDAEDPLAVVKKAEQKGWKVRQLQRYLETGLEPGEKSQINVDVLAMARPNAEAVGSSPPEMKVLSDQAMIDFCIDIKRGIQEWQTRCVDAKFSSNVLKMWLEEVDDYLEKYTLDSWRKLVVHAWNRGKRIESEIADFAGIPRSEIHSVMKNYEREGVFEKVVRAKTDKGKGTHPWIWHLVGQPLGSNYVRPRS